MVNNNMLSVTVRLGRLDSVLKGYCNQTTSLDFISEMLFITEQILQLIKGVFRAFS